MWGFSADGSVTDKDIYNENIISNIANTFTENNESISETNKTKQHNIQEYIHNLVSTNTTDNSLETNISRNLELCNETDQTNDLTIGGIKLGGKFNKIEKSQINETTNTISQRSYRGIKACITHRFSAVGRYRTNIFCRKYHCRECQC